MRNTPAGTKSGRKWLAHLAASVGTANKSATIRVRRLPATARMAKRSTKESKKDTMRSPPLISSTKGAQAKNRARAMRSCTAEKRRGFGDFAACMISSIQLRKFRIFTPSGVPGHLGSGVARAALLLFGRSYQSPIALTPIGPNPPNCSTSTLCGPAVSSVGIRDCPAICC